MLDREEITRTIDSMLCSNFFTTLSVLSERLLLADAIRDQVRTEMEERENLADEIKTFVKRNPRKIRKVESDSSQTTEVPVRRKPGRPRKEEQEQKG